MSSEGCGVKGLGSLHSREMTKELRPGAFQKPMTHIYLWESWQGGRLCGLGQGMRRLLPAQSAELSCKTKQTGGRPVLNQSQEHGTWM